MGPTPITMGTGKNTSECYKNAPMMFFSLLITSDSFWCIVARENQPRTVKCAQMNPFHAVQATRKRTQIESAIKPTRADSLEAKTLLPP